MLSRSWLHHLIAVILFAGLSACGADDDPPRTNLGAGATGPGPLPTEGGAGALLPPGYPDGPFGGDAGEIIFNYEFEGFVNESAVGDPLEQPFGSYSMSDMRESGKSYAFLALAETWCLGCQVTAAAIGARADEMVALDAVVVDVLLSGERAELEAWIATYDLTVTTVLSVTPSMNQDLGGRERGVIVDLATMEIVYNELGEFGENTLLLDDALAKLTELGASGS